MSANPQHRIVGRRTEIIATQVSQKHTGHRIDVVLLHVLEARAKRRTATAARIKLELTAALERIDQLAA